MTTTKRKTTNEETLQEESSSTQEVRELSPEEQALLDLIAAEEAEKPDEQAIDDAKELLNHNVKLSEAARTFPKEKIPAGYVKVIAVRRFGQRDPQSKRGVSKTIAGATGTGIRMVEPKHYAIISNKMAMGLQKNHAIEIVLE